MFLKDYVCIHEKISIEDLMSFQKEKIIRYDFLKQGEEPDRCSLINEIYEKIFPNFNKEIHAGDTINTYRIAIKKFYGNYYRFLNRELQSEIIAIIKKYTPHDNDQIFEFEAIDKNGKAYYQVCNNYQLGNFIIFPTKNGINPKRSKAPYLDFFDNFLNVIWDYYEENEIFVQDDEIKTAITSQSDYFAQFDDFTDYVDCNFLRDFFIMGGDGNFSIVDLNNSNSFEEYVSKITKIIAKRGETIWKELNKISDFQKNNNGKELHEIIAQKSAEYKIKYKIDDKTADKLAELVEIEIFFNTRNSIINKKTIKIDEIEQKYSSEVSDVQNTNYINKKFEWLKWWIWPILFIGWGWFYNIYSNHLGLLHYSKKIEFKTNLLHFSSNLFYLFFWILLISIITYRINYNKKIGDFEQDRIKQIESIKKRLDNKIENISKIYNEKIELFDIQNTKIIELFHSFPENYQNEYDISSLIFYIKNGRADNLKEAYEVLENEKHRQRLELEAERQTWVAEETAREQRRAAQESVDNARRQTQAAEELTRETERHNREIESQWNRNN